MRNDDNTEISIYNKMNSFFSRCNKIMKIKRIYALVFALLMLLPVLVSATVVISYTYPTTTSANTPDIYLAQGPNYNTAYALGLFSATNTSNDGITSGTSITIDTVAGAGAVYLLNVLTIYNNTPSSVKGPVYVWINITSNPGFTLYYSTSPLTYTGPTSASSPGVPSGTAVTGSMTSPIQLSTHGTALYIGFMFSGTLTGTSGSITIQYKYGT